MAIVQTHQDASQELGLSNDSVLSLPGFFDAEEDNSIMERDVIAKSTPYTSSPPKFKLCSSLSSIELDHPTNGISSDRSFLYSTSLALSSEAFFERESTTESEDEETSRVSESPAHEGIARSVVSTSHQPTKLPKGFVMAKDVVRQRKQGPLQPSILCVLDEDPIDIVHPTIREFHAAIRDLEVEAFQTRFVQTQARYRPTVNPTRGRH